MPFQKIATEKLSSMVIRQIEQLILRGILRPGERLPAERELAERLAVSRPSLREAIAELQEKGLLTSKAGSGIFVANVLGNAFSPSLIALFRAHEETTFDYLSFRRDMEGLAANRAAKHASETDLMVIQSIFDNMVMAHDKRSTRDEAQLDAKFHMSIIEASNNVVMLHMMRSMFDLLTEGVFYNRKQMFKQKVSRTQLLEQHRAINSALQKRELIEAQNTVEIHLEYVETMLNEAVISLKNKAISKQRYDHTQRDIPAKGQARKIPSV